MHFLFLGIVLNDISGRLFPEPLPVIGPLSAERISLLRQQWIGGTKTIPSSSQLNSMIESELDRDMMFQFAISRELHLYDPVVYQRLLRNMAFLRLSRENSKEKVFQDAIGMRMHLGDEVIKRRMIQVVEQILVARNPPQFPREKEIKQAFENRKKEFRRPKRYTLQHLYFPISREVDFSLVLEAIRKDNLSPEQARKFSSPFLPGYEFFRQSGEQLSRRFGYEFTKNLVALDPKPQNWVGPVDSTYGQHLVWIKEIELERDATLSEVKKEVVRDLESRAYRAVLTRELGKLRMEYEIRK